MPVAEVPATDAGFGIQDVWRNNFQREFKHIRQVVKTHKFVAMDTEFPGVVARPIGEFRSTSEYQFQLLRCNVNMLKIIQIGITFFDQDGQRAQPISTWQFNFKFNLNRDMYAQESIALLRKSGIQFDRHDNDGIEQTDFAEELIMSGVVLMPDISWLSFHSGYDFGYMIRILQGGDLPEDEEEFFNVVKIYFSKIYDVKYLMKSCKTLKGGLQEVADQLEIARIGPQHQAGSDSLLTGDAFFKMREVFFDGIVDDNKYCGHLYGLGASFVTNGNSAELFGPHMPSILEDIPGINPTVAGGCQMVS